MKLFFSKKKIFNIKKIRDFQDIRKQKFSSERKQEGKKNKIWKIKNGRKLSF